MFWFMKVSDLKNFVIEVFKITPIYFTISLGLVLNTVVNATCLSAASTHVFSQQI